MSTQLTLDGRDTRYRVVEAKSGWLQPCFGAKCVSCGKWLTKWDFTREDAESGAAHEFDRRDGHQHICGVSFS